MDSRDAAVANWVAGTADQGPELRVRREMAAGRDEVIVGKDNLVEVESETREGWDLDEAAATLGAAIEGLYTAESGLAEQCQLEKTTPA